MGAIVEYDRNLYLYKHGSRVRRNEADALRLIEQHTSVPVPHVFDSYFGDVGIIVMSFINGQPLSTLWDEMPSQHKHSILAQLKGYIAQWRRIPQPSECDGAYSCGILGGSLSPDVAVPGRDFTGPFATNLEFRKAIADSYYQNAGRRVTPEEVVASLPPSQSVLTHCDLSPRNVLVDGTKITGIIDWEFSGWYPEYFEHAMVSEREWDYLTPEFLDPHPPERDAIVRLRHVLF